MPKDLASTQIQHHFYRVRLVHPKSLGLAFGVVSFLGYSLALLGTLLLSFFNGLFKTILLIPMLSGIFVFPGLFFLLGILIGYMYNLYARLTGGIVLEIAPWNP